MAATYIIEARYADDRIERSEGEATALFYGIGDLWLNDEEAPESVTIKKKPVEAWCACGHQRHRHSRRGACLAETDHHIGLMCECDQFKAVG